MSVLDALRPRYTVELVSTITGSRTKLIFYRFRKRERAERAVRILNANRWTPPSADAWWDGPHYEVADW